MILLQADITRLAASEWTPAFVTVVLLAAFYLMVYPILKKLIFDLLGQLSEQRKGTAAIITDFLDTLRQHNEQTKSNTEVLTKLVEKVEKITCGYEAAMKRGQS